MENIRNRKTLQIIINNRKTEINFVQNRKPRAKSEKLCTRLRSLRRIFSEEKPEKHQTASNSKFENPILFLPKTESEIEQKPQTTMVTKTENPKFLGTKTEKPFLKMAETAKPNFPMPPPPPLQKWLVWGLIGKKVET